MDDPTENIDYMTRDTDYAAYYKKDSKTSDTTIVDTTNDTIVDTTDDTTNDEESIVDDSTIDSIEHYATWPTIIGFQCNGSVILGADTSG